MSPQIPGGLVLVLSMTTTLPSSPSLGHVGLHTAVYPFFLALVSAVGFLLAFLLPSTFSLVLQSLEARKLLFLYFLASRAMVYVLFHEKVLHGVWKMEEEKASLLQQW